MSGYAGAGRHRPIVRPLIESALEGGLSHSDAVTLAIAVYKEIDLLARGPSLNILPPATLREIRGYARAILRSGSTFSAFEIAQRAVAAHRLAQEEIRKLDMEWRTETVGKRLRRVREREERNLLRQPDAESSIQKSEGRSRGRYRTTEILDLDDQWLDHDSLSGNLEDAVDVAAGIRVGGRSLKPWEIEE